MRLFIISALAVLVISCKSGSNKTKVEVKDDTARMTHPPAGTVSIEPVKISKNDLPSLSYKGSLQETWKWNDNLGENIFFTSYVAPYADSRKSEFDEEGQTSELYAYHYAKKGNDYVQVWKLEDGVQG